MYTVCKLLEVFGCTETQATPPCDRNQTVRVMRQSFEWVLYPKKHPGLERPLKWSSFFHFAALNLISSIFTRIFSAPNKNKFGPWSAFQRHPEAVSRPSLEKTRLPGIWANYDNSYQPVCHFQLELQHEFSPNMVKHIFRRLSSDLSRIQT